MNNFKKKNFLSHADINHYFENLINNQSFANGYIFYGPEGVGKKQTAYELIVKIFKKSSIVKLEEKISNNNHPDLLIIEPKSFIKSNNSKKEYSESKKNNNSDVIKIEEIRRVKNFLSQKSIESDKKIVLIIDAHLLNEAASNCLLKTLEEPNNGIFLLITSKLNLLLDTIKSRCQLIRFKSSSIQRVETYLKKNLECNMQDIHDIMDFQDLVNAANGSPGQVLKKIHFWRELSEEIVNKLDYPLKNFLEIFKISKLISEELETNQQICLIDLIQQKWWRKTKNINLIKKLENLRIQLKGNLQPRLAWEVTFLKIAMEEQKD